MSSYIFTLLFLTVRRIASYYA